MLEAADAAEALELLSMRMAKVDLVLLDVVLPGTDGVQLYGEICARRPGIPVVFMSAYPAEILAAHGQKDLTAPFLGKPYTRQELVTLVGQTIERRRAPRVRSDGPSSSEESQESNYL